MALTTALPTLTANEVVDKLRALRARQPVKYWAFYSSQLGGIVTDNGGLLSHAAIVSREYGIPGVVGTREATERIADGARIRVDGDAGEVTLLV